MKCPGCGYDNIQGEDECSSCGTSLYEFSIPRAKNGVQKRILEGTLADLNPHNAVTVAPSATVASTVKLMREHQMGCVLVLENERLSGICTERDILMEVAGVKDPAKVKISTIMKAKPQCLMEGDAIAFAFHNMALKGYRHIPIMRTNGTLGIISSRDLLRYLCS